MDKRYLQANKEAKLSLLITVLYLVFWSISGYFLSDKTGVTGFPAWFEASCIFAPIGFILVCYLVVKYQFKDIPLDNQSSESSTHQ